MNTSRSAVAIAASALASGTLVLTLVGCSTEPSPDLKESYPTFAAAQEIDSRLPGLLPGDATDIQVVARNVGKGAILKFNSTAGITAEYCKAGPLDGTPTELTADWWPTAVPDDGYDCSRWMVFEADGSYFAWDTAD